MGETYAKAPYWLLSCPDVRRLGHTTLALLLAALDQPQDANGERAVSVRSLARKLGIDPGNAQRSWKSILRAGFFVWTGAKRTHWLIYRDGPRLAEVRASAVTATAPNALSRQQRKRCHGYSGSAVTTTAQPDREPDSEPDQRSRELAGAAGCAPLAERGEQTLAALAQFRTWTGRDPSVADRKLLTMLAREYPDSRAWRRATASGLGDAHSAIGVLRHRLAEEQKALDAEAEAQEKRDADSKSRMQAGIDDAMRALKDSEDLVRGEPLTWREAEKLYLKDIIEHDNGKRAAVLAMSGGRMQVVDELGHIVDVQPAEIGSWHQTCRGSDCDASGERAAAPFAPEATRPPAPRSDCLAALVSPARGAPRPPRKCHPALR